MPITAKVNLDILYTESVISRFFGWPKIRGKHLLDDQVSALSRNPLGMFFYNQRALFFGASLVVILSLWTTLAFIPSTQRAYYTLGLLSFFWLLGVGVTLGLHSSFRAVVARWSSEGSTTDLWPLFDKYFLLDSLVVFFLVALGSVSTFLLTGFVFLLFANTVVYAAYIGGSKRTSLWITVTIFGLLVGAVLLASSQFLIVQPTDIVEMALLAAPILAMFTITILSLFTVSILRSRSYHATQRHLELLGEYEARLSFRGDQEELLDYGEKDYRGQLQKILRELCNSEPAFWYNSACLWLLENHKDRGTLVLPGPAARYDTHQYRFGIKGNFDPSTWKRPVLKVTLEEVTSEGEVWLQRLSPRPERRLPAALVPINSHNEFLGFIVFYGTPGICSLPPHELEFLTSLGSIVGNTLEQRRERFRLSAQKEMNSLLSAGSLTEVFDKAASILQTYLMAAGTMIVFRPDPQGEMMSVGEGYRGFKREVSGLVYRVGHGMTGKCAARGLVERLDDVALHRGDFDENLLSQLETYLGSSIRSWMAIPIGGEQKNYGVIKVVNSQFRCSWFTDYDQDLGENLALRLEVVIDKWLHIERAENALKETQEHAAAAVLAQSRALQLAQERQEDLMIITHQLEGALAAVIGALTSIGLEGASASQNKDLLQHAKALVEDAIALSYGTSRIFAKEAGREIFFSESEIDAPTELRALATRLQRTTPPQSGVKFEYNETKGFPAIRVDRNVFTSVFYSLIHNALKYAHPQTTIILECSYELDSLENSRAALKVKSWGEPIDMTEREEIFLKFKRGRRIERGRLHRGVGLGLWVARELMRAIGGELTVEISRRHTNLSVFVVTFPEQALVRPRTLAGMRKIGGA